ncbi:MAG: winged helix-turn-helix transcriptional regulator [Hyphomicrobiaceae bacterium]|nr:winged helix-turn-helix transcriptional regulator [Hyphomicrobiaceae bacterium]
MAKLKLSADLIEDLSQLFRLLSDQTRLRIVLLLADGPKNVGDLCKRLNLPQPTVSHHLGLLCMSKVILNRRNGKQVIYSVNDTALTALGKRFLSAASGGKKLVLGSFTLSSKG